VKQLFALGCWAKSKALGDLRQELITNNSFSALERGGRRILLCEKKHRASSIKQ